jgi:acyl-CoA thioesterase FadM
MVAINSQFNQTIEKNSIITTEESNKIYTITMQNIKFNTSREVILLLLVAPIWLTTPAYADDKPGSEVDQTQIRNERRLCQQRFVKQGAQESVAKTRCITKCETERAAKALPINQRLKEEVSRTPRNRSVINSLEKQRLEVFAEIKRCRN